MRPCRRRIASIAILTILATLTATLATLSAPPQASAATLRQRLQTARHELREARGRLERARAALAAALARRVGDAAPSASLKGDAPTPPPGSDALPVPTPSPLPAARPVPLAPVAAGDARELAALHARVRRARHAVRVWERRVARLARQYRLQRRLAEWERRGAWLPIIRVAAARYHVSASAVYTLMLRESGGRRTAGTVYIGLFQYHPATWRASWNPWRHESIYDGSAQIFATCYAVSRGLAPRMWPNTWPGG